jgi:hypothetical protein
MPNCASEDVTLDATVSPNQEATRKAWQDTITARERREEAGRELFRRMSGTSTPSSVVRSAEGVTQFNGLYENGNGALSEAARQALKDSMGAINLASDESQQVADTADANTGDAVA